ncbi:hypothetical protein CB1_001095024 [Camelus ferus]|nr:hypothetical protein CB1_001095024 [Camelus ferus]
MHEGRIIVTPGKPFRFFRIQLYPPKSIHHSLPPASTGSWLWKPRCALWPASEPLCTPKAFWGRNIPSWMQGSSGKSQREFRSRKALTRTQSKPLALHEESGETWPGPTGLTSSTLIFVDPDPSTVLPEHAHSGLLASPSCSNIRDYMLRFFGSLNTSPHIPPTSTMIPTAVRMVLH